MRRSGHAVDWQADGLAAASVLRYQSFDLVVLDIGLPKLDGLRVLAENHRTARDSWKLDLALPDGGQLELFSFPSPPPRPSRPEAQGLRHLAFRVTALEPFIQRLAAHGVTCEPIRVDEYTGRRFTFFADPDDLPLELYEVG